MIIVLVKKLKNRGKKRKELKFRKINLKNKAIFLTEVYVTFLISFF